MVDTRHIAGCDIDGGDTWAAVSFASRIILPAPSRGSS